jgi:hypothetical protein
MAPCARSRPGKRRPSPWRSTVSGAVLGLERRPRQLKAYGGGMFVAPDAARRRRARRRALGADGKSHFLRALPRCSRASTSTIRA